MAIDMKLLKELRAMTHAPLGACKDALVEANGDIAKAQEVLREKGALKAAKKADRVTDEGIVVVGSFDDKVVGLTLACETDFVAKNEIFKALGKSIVEKLSVLDSLDSYVNVASAIKDEIDFLIKDSFVTLRENMRVVEAFVKNGTHYTYIHSGDKIASIIFYTGDEMKAKPVALQVAAMNPSYLSLEEVPVEEKEKYREEIKEEVKASGKPENIVERIVDGKLGKIWSEIVLLEQVSIMDDGKKVKDMLGDTIITGYTRLSI